VSVTNKGERDRANNPLATIQTDTLDQTPRDKLPKRYTVVTKVSKMHGGQLHLLPCSDHMIGVWEMVRGRVGEYVCVSGRLNCVDDDSEDDVERPLQGPSGSVSQSTLLSARQRQRCTAMQQKQLTVTLTSLRYPALSTVCSPYAEVMTRSPLHSIYRA
jgi:hypothetical protein